VSAPGVFDLDATSREALELDAVLAYVASFAATTTGRGSLLASSPSADGQALFAEHAAVAEAGSHLVRFGRMLPAGIADPDPALRVLAVDGLTVDPIPLRDLASALLEAATLRTRLSGIQGEGFAALQALARAIPDLRGLAGEVAEHIAADGSIDDGASPELRRVRLAIAKTGLRLRRQLEAFLNDPAAATIVRDDFVTQRNGRFVIPVRADSPRPVEGIVHAASSSGQTLFVEPIESVALNNDLVRLAEAEAAEAERVMRGWTERFRARRPEIDAAIEGLGRADALQAKALFGTQIEGCSPVVAPQAPLRLVSARHPLLDRRLKDQGARCVPVTIEIDPYDRVLVISGPNTGGKTVALKTVGLACVMAQCGLPVAAVSASLPVFRQLRADIGDHQSIDADLSTFSAHVRAVARYLDDAASPALFLFDEIGTGTEPGEGAALAQAVLERLLTLRVTAIATTHHAALKGWAFAQPGVESAAMEFDEATLRPTYRVIAGVAGASAGIEIAARLGLDAALVARARELRGSGGMDAEDFMARLRDATAEAEARVVALQQGEDALAASRARDEAKAKDEAARLRDETKNALASALGEFKELSRRELAAIKDVKERAKTERLQLRAESRLRALARERQHAIAPADPGTPNVPLVVAAGARVRIVSLDREGEIVSVRGDRVEVRMGSATFSVARNDVEAPSAADGPTAGAPTAKRSRLADLAAASRSKGGGDSSDETPSELHLLGQTVDEALPQVDKFLDAAARLGRTEVRIVHGHGTGRLRLAVRAHLKGHPQVDVFRPGGPGEGGDGATVVALR
jgi:DNA mismatch repair protein MutS2